MKTTKSIALLCFFLIFMFSCEEDQLTSNTTSALNYDVLVNPEISSSGNNIANLCHWSEDDGIWSIVSVNKSAVPSHLDHGDVLLIDADGDGWVTSENECVPGGDCNDNNPDVYPGAEEICGNGIDDNCDGNIDEDCTPNLAIGDMYAGGIIFYLDGSGGGKVAALADAETLKNWDEAISYCDNLATTEGDVDYQDWYLPSKDELNLMYENLHKNDLGGFAGSNYWSSTEYNFLYSWIQHFGTGGQNGEDRSNFHSVRAARAF